MAPRHIVAATTSVLAAVGILGVTSLGHDVLPIEAEGSPATATPARTVVDGAAPATGTPSPSATATLPTGIHAVVALGDSVPAGSGSNAVPFPELLRRALAPANPGVALTNLGNDGETAADLADSLRHDEQTRAAVRSADVVLVTAGANDLLPALEARGGPGCNAECTDEAVDGAARAMRSVLSGIGDVDGRPGRHVLVTTYWNAFTDGVVARNGEDQATLDWSDRLTRRVNAAFCRAADAAGAVCVDTYVPFKGDGSKDPTGLLAGDGDHPNQAGHSKIEQALLAALRRETRH